MILRLERHAENGALLRLIDGEADADQAAALEKHLASCAMCRARQRRFERLSARFSDLVAEVDGADVPERARRPRSPWMLATLLLVIVAALALAPPVRAWVIEAWTAVHALAFGPRVPEPPMGSVSFEPRGPVFTLAVTGPRSGGTITLVQAVGDRVTVTLEPGGGSDELVVLGNGLAIRRGRRSAVSYEIGIPRSVDTVLATLEGRPVHAIPRAALEAGPRHLPMGTPQ